MRKGVLTGSTLLLALAGCHANIDTSGKDVDRSGDNVQVAMKDDGAGGSAVSVKVPGVNANVSLPGLNLSSHVDLNGITLAPDTKVSTINVDAQDKGAADQGKVQLTFTNPHGVSDLLDHYAASAKSAGYGAIARSTTGLTATKGDASVAVEALPDGTGSRGTITVQDKH